MKRGDWIGPLLRIVSAASFLWQAGDYAKRLGAHKTAPVTNESLSVVLMVVMCVVAAHFAWPSKESKP